MSQRLGRCLVILLALALVAGAVMQGAQASAMAVRMAAVADTGMPHDCGGCADDDHGLPAACVAVCGSLAAAVLPSAPATVVEGAPAPATTPTPVIEGRHAAPEPYPPRSASLA